MQDYILNLTPNVLSYFSDSQLESVLGHLELSPGQTSRRVAGLPNSLQCTGQSSRPTIASQTASLPTNRGPVPEPFITTGLSHALSFRALSSSIYLVSRSVYLTTTIYLVDVEHVKLTSLHYSK